MLPHFHRCCQKTWVSWVRDKGYYFFVPNHTKTVDQSPQPPVSTELKQSWAQVDVAHSRLVSRLRVLSLENHNLTKEMTANLSSLFQEGDIISLSWSVNKPVSDCEGGPHFYLPRLFAIQIFFEFSPGPKFIYVQIYNRDSTS